VRSLDDGSAGLTVDDIYLQNYFDILIRPVISNLFVEGIEKTRRYNEPGSRVGPKTLQACKHNDEAIGGRVAESCNYTSYLSKYLTYPPLPAPFPLPGSSVNADPGCDVWSEIFNAALILNPAFDMYRIFDMVCIHDTNGRRSCGLF